LAHALTGLDAVGPEKLGDRKEKPPQLIEISQNAEKKMADYLTGVVETEPAGLK
jgi:hypothetical protein